MNRIEYAELLEEIESKLTEAGGTFQDMFGVKSEEEMKEVRYIAAIAMVTADRLYSRATQADFDSTKNA